MTYNTFTVTDITTKTVIGTFTNEVEAKNCGNEYYKNTKCWWTVTATEK